MNSVKNIYFAVIVYIADIELLVVKSCPGGSVLLNKHRVENVNIAVAVNVADEVSRLELRDNNLRNYPLVAAVAE